MTSPTLPTTMRAWQYTTTKGGLENCLHINPTTPLPTPKPNQHLVQILSTALNPVDYKPAEVTLFSRIAIPKPATPGLDYAGLIAVPAKDSPLKRGDLVFGCAGKGPLAGGALAEFALAGTDATVLVPAGVRAVDAATIGVAGLTAYQSILPRVKRGDRVFINGGSGGTGVFGIQIAKAVGCHVTTTCSGANVELCKSLGADDVVDYRKERDLVEALKSRGEKFDLVVDNVGMDKKLYWKCHEYTTPKAVYVMIAGVPSLAFLWDMIKRKVWPGWAGGMKREFSGFFAKPMPEDLEAIVKWMAEGKVKPVIDQRFGFEEAPKAFQKLKTLRARGKIVVDVAPEEEIKD